MHAKNLLSRSMLTGLLSASLLLALLPACMSGPDKPPGTDTQARILEVTTNLEESEGWLIVPEGGTQLQVNVTAEEVDTVLFWLAASGTDSWQARELIGTDTDGSDGWALDWSFGERDFHDHLLIQALGSDGLTMASETLNLTSAQE